MSYLQCKASKEAVTLDRTWLKLFHPASATDLMGLLELELYLVPGTEVSWIESCLSSDVYRMMCFLGYW